MAWDTSKKEIVAITLSAMVTTAGAATPQATITPKSLDDFNKIAYKQIRHDGAWDNIARISHVDDSDQIGIIDIGDIVNSIKIGLGLPDKDIAEILQVSRQTIHTYRTQEASSINLKENTRLRAYNLFEIINELNLILDKSPGPATKNILVNHTTLFELLCKDELDSELILDTTSRLEAKIQKDRQLSNTKRDLNATRKRTLHSLTKNT